MFFFMAFCLKNSVISLLPVLALHCHPLTAHMGIPDGAAKGFVKAINAFEKS